MTHDPVSSQPLLPPTLGPRPAVFFGNDLLHTVQNLRRRLHQPEKRAEPVLRADQPWEHITYFTCNTWNVIQDPQDGKFKCWYEDWDWTSWRDRKFNDTRLLYAESTDGVRWDKPALGIVRADGHDTNVVLGGGAYGAIHAATVFLDPADPDPARRFKVIYKRHRERDPHAKQRFGNEIITWDLAVSPDGIRWTSAPENPLTVSTLYGDVLIAQRDCVSDKVVLMGRPHNCSTWSTSNPASRWFHPPYDPAEPFGFLNKRNVWRTDSDDGLSWSPARQCIRQDADDNLDDGFYGLNHFRVGELNVGILNILHSADNTMDIELVYSTDDWRTWRRPFRNVPYVPRGEAGAWDEFMVTCCSAPVTAGDRTLVYHGGACNHHDWWMYPDMGPDVPEKGNLDMVKYCLGLATLRRDGYVSLDAGPLEGTLVTRPFARGGSRLVINAACGAGGRLAVEVQDIYGQTWPGLAGEDCDAFTGDCTEHTVSWRGRDDLSAAGRHLKLKIAMQNASLYSLALR